MSIVLALFFFLSCLGILLAGIWLEGLVTGEACWNRMGWLGGYLVL